MTQNAIALKAQILALTALFLFSCANILDREEVSGKVVYVTDGDTFIMKTEMGEKLKIRVADIDCPELKQKFGLEAKEFTVNQVLNKTVKLKILKIDRYGRKVAQVKYGPGKDLSEELIKNGYAWHYKQYSKDENLASLERSARREGRGLWSDREPVAPWEFRKYAH